jgi:hypothetical protein
MSKLIAAHTNVGTLYPGYINFTLEDDGSVSVYLRGDPTTKDGCYICAHAHQKGEPGRCTAGDEHCNNYCNMAPEKGPMQDSPKDCEQVYEGATAKLTLSASDFEALKAGIS